MSTRAARSPRRWPGGWSLRGRLVLVAVPVDPEPVLLVALFLLELGVARLRRRVPCCRRLQVVRPLLRLLLVVGVLFVPLRPFVPSSFFLLRPLVVLLSLCSSLSLYIKHTIQRLIK